MKLITNQNWTIRAAFLTALMLTACVSPPQQTTGHFYTVRNAQSSSNPQSVGIFGDKAMLTDAELHQELQAFADRYIQRVVQAAENATKTSKSSEEREVFQRFKTASAASAVSIAIEQNPLHGLRDMRVMVRLQHLVWKNGGPKGVSTEQATDINDVLAKLELAIDALASHVIPASDMQELNARIDAWYEQRSEQTDVAFIRFQNLDLPGTQLDSNTSNVGLLAPVSQTAHELNETRKMADRALFLANHMPMLAQWRGELLVSHLLSSPEVVEYLDEAKSIRETLRQLIEETNRAQARLSEERQQIQQEMELYRPILQTAATDFHLLPEHLASEREAFFSALDSRATTYQPMLNQIKDISQNSLEASLAAERVVNKLYEDKAGDIPFAAKLDKVLLISARAERATAVLETLLGPNAKVADLDVLDARIAAHERRIFSYVAMLLVLLAVLVTGMRFIWIRMGKVHT